jgi:DNA-binding transcriptional ArsR family regulator
MVEELAVRDHSAGELGAVAHTEFGVSQPAVSRHLRVLREAGLVTSRADGPRRIYSLDRDSVDEMSDWVEQLRALWGASLSALSTEIARGRRDRHGSDPQGETR